MQVMGSVMPRSPKWASHRFTHLLPNSVFSSSSGIKLPAKAALRPSVQVPTMRSAGISTSPTFTGLVAAVSSMISFSTWG